MLLKLIVGLYHALVWMDAAFGTLGLFILICSLLGLKYAVRWQWTKKQPCLMCHKTRTKVFQAVFVALADNPNAVHSIDPKTKAPIFAKRYVLQDCPHCDTLVYLDQRRIYKLEVFIRSRFDLQKVFVRGMSLDEWACREDLNRYVFSKEELEPEVPFDCEGSFGIL